MSSECTSAYATKVLILINQQQTESDSLRAINGTRYTANAVNQPNKRNKQSEQSRKLSLNFYGDDISYDTVCVSVWFM
jgi:hypothetical protein